MRTMYWAIGLPFVRARFSGPHHSDTHGTPGSTSAAGIFARASGKSGSAGKRPCRPAARKWRAGLDLDAGSGLEADAMTTTSAIEIAGLTKSYGDHVVLGGLDSGGPAGQVGALPGANGAGKTTVVKILSTLLRADGGTAAVNGIEVATQPGRVREPISRT